MILSDFQSCSDQTAQESLSLINNEGRKGTHGGYGVAECVLRARGSEFAIHRSPYGRTVTYVLTALYTVEL